MLVAVLSCNVAADWKGVDETVIEKVATEAGRPPQRPLLDTEQGDLLLFLFLTAGAIGGFIGGYSFRTLFPPRKHGKETGGEMMHVEDGSVTAKALTLTLSQGERGLKEGGSANA